MIAIQCDRYVPVYSNTLLDSFRFLFAKKHRLPGKDMFWFVEIAIGDERQSLQTDWIEDVISVRHCPSIQQRRVLVDMFPKIERVLAPMGLKFMRVRRDCQCTLGMNLGNSLGNW